MFLPLDMCRDPGRGQILTTTITIQVLNKGGREIILSVVYEKNWITQRNLVGGFETYTPVSWAYPWAMLGDFNATRFISEKQGGNKLTFGKLQSLINLLMADLSNISCSGNY